MEFSRQVGCHFLFQGIFPTQGLNLHLLCLLHWQGDISPGKPVVNWLAWDEAKMQGTLQSVPGREEIPENAEMQLIVELYSR